MGIAAGVSAGVGLLSGGAKFFQGKKMERKAQAAIDNFQWQELKNPYENLQVSRLGADLQREEATRNTATSVNTLQQAGSRSLIGGLGRVQANNNLLNRQIAADLDQKQKQIDFATAGQAVRNQEVVEGRQANELAGYGQQMNVGMNTKYGGMSDMMNSIGMLGQMGGLGKGAGSNQTTGGYTPQVQGIGSTAPLQSGVNFGGSSPMGGIPMQNGIPSNYQF